MYTTIANALDLRSDKKTSFMRQNPNHCGLYSSMRNQKGLQASFHTFPIWELKLYIVSVRSNRNPAVFCHVVLLPLV